MWLSFNFLLCIINFDKKAKKMIDTHAHLNDSKLYENRQQIINNATMVGVSHIFCVGYDLPSSLLAKEIANEYQQVYAVIGTHPHDAKTYTYQVEMEYETLAKNNKRIVAIGEIGLDYHYDFSPREIQKQVFVSQLKLADKLGLPIVIHTREAWDDTLQILKENKKYLNHGGILHCFDGSIEIAKQVMELGFMIAFGGSITFKKSEYLIEVLKQIPLDNIVLETDCPYLTPIPFRGKEINQPKYIPVIAQKMAEVFNISPEQVDEITTNNAKRVYRV